MVKHGFRVPSPSEVAVKCRFLVYRNRVERETDLLVGKREDLLRRVDGRWKIARRKIVLDQSVRLAKIPASDKAILVRVSGAGAVFEAVVSEADRNG